MINIKKYLTTDKYVLGATLFRLAFGMLFLFAAINKFRNGYTGFANYLVNADDTINREIPQIILYLYGLTLPAVLFISGILLIINKWTKQVYITAGLVYLTFIFGQMYNGNGSKIATEYFPSLLSLVVAYFLNDEAEKKELLT